jgi:retron-type reverse transcriptase
MRNLSTVLEVLYKRGQQGKKVNRVYKHLFNLELWEQAWAEIYDNKGAMTPGIDPGDTADGMSYEVFEEIMALLRAERYTPAPVRRTYIPKKDGRLRPLGLPGFRDKPVPVNLRESGFSVA